MGTGGGGTSTMSWPPRLYISAKTGADTPVNTRLPLSGFGKAVVSGLTTSTFTLVSTETCRFYVAMTFKTAKGQETKDTSRENKDGKNVKTQQNISLEHEQI